MSKRACEVFPREQPSVSASTSGYVRRQKQTETKVRDMPNLFKAIKDFLDTFLQKEEPIIIGSAWLGSYIKENYDISAWAEREVKTLTAQTELGHLIAYYLFDVVHKVPHLTKDREFADNCLHYKLCGKYFLHRIDEAVEYAKSPLFQEQGWDYDGSPYSRYCDGWIICANPDYREFDTHGAFHRAIYKMIDEVYPELSTRKIRSDKDVKKPKSEMSIAKSQKMADIQELYNALDDDTIALLRQYGNGSIGAGVKKAIWELSQHHSEHVCDVKNGILKDCSFCNSAGIKAEVQEDEPAPVEEEAVPAPVEQQEPIPPPVEEDEPAPVEEEKPKKKLVIKRPILIKKKPPQ